MFQDTLLIIKPDYLVKRKALLLYLLQQGFLIKGQRKTCFTPELAAEFYKNRADDASFMFQVILLSKGNSEAFILAKQSGVEELINLMVCYFGNSAEMEKNIHVTHCLNKVHREISFIFPNYIHEPIYCPDQIKFCANNPLVETTISTLYNIVTSPEKHAHKSWKETLAESLILANKTLPRISNLCCQNLRHNAQDVAQQTNLTCLKYNENALGRRSLSPDLSKDCSSLNVTTSSCVSCSGFNSGSECAKHTLEQIVKARSAPLIIGEPSSSSNLQEDVLEELNMEEHIFATECDDPAEKGGEAYFKYAAKNEVDIKHNAEPMSNNEMSDVESTQLSNKNNKLSIENILTKFEESIISVAEENKEIDEEISPDVIPDKEMSGMELSNKENKPSIENMSTKFEESIHSTAQENEEIFPLPEVVAAEEHTKSADEEKLPPAADDSLSVTL